MSSAQIKVVMEIKKNELSAAFVELGKQHAIQADKLSKAYAEEITELGIQLKRAEADEAWNVGLAARQEAKLVSPQAYADGGDELCYHCSGYVESCGCDGGSARSPSPVLQEEFCYHCGAEEVGCRCGEELAQEQADAAAALEEAEEHEESAFKSQLNAAAETFVPEHREGTKLKWVSSTNPETYSVAIVKNDGILEVKRVTDGGGHCHDTTVCHCRPCSEIALSQRLGAPMPPWLSRAPLLKTFYETEADWRASLPTGGSRGSIKTTVPAISARTLKKLCCTPLTGATDGLKLKELAERFPGGTMVLTTTKEQLEIEHIYYDIAAYTENWRHQIYSKKHELAVFDFANLGDSPRSNGKPQIMVLWKGLYIDVSHLF